MKKVQPVAKEFAEFEKYSKGIGSKILYKMGYRPGQGLGKDGKGLAEPIQVKLRPSGVGIGHGEQQDEEFKVEKPSRAHNKVRRREKIVTSLEIIKDVEESVIKDQKIDIIDMTGPESKRITDMSLLPKAQEGPCAELRYNVDALTNLAKKQLELIAKHRKGLNSLIESRKVEILETEKLIMDNTLEKENATLVVNVMIKCKPFKNYNDPLEIYNSLNSELARLDGLFEKESYQLEAFFCRIISKSFKQLFLDWNPLMEPLRGYNVIMAWAGALHYHQKPNSQIMSPFEALLYQNWLPLIRQSIKYFKTKIVMIGIQWNQIQSSI